MTEKLMVFFHIKELAKKYNMSTRTVGRLLRNLGLKRWSKSNPTTGAIWYWRED